MVEMMVGLMCVAIDGWMGSTTTQAVQWKVGRYVCICLSVCVW